MRSQQVPKLSLPIGAPNNMKIVTKVHHSYPEAENHSTNKGHTEVCTTTHCIVGWTNHRLDTLRMNYLTISESVMDLAIQNDMVWNT